MSKKLILAVAVLLSSTVVMAAELDDREWQFKKVFTAEEEHPTVYALLKSRHSKNITSTALGIKCDKNYFFVSWVLDDGYSFEAYHGVEVTTSFDDAAKIVNWKPSNITDAVMYPDSKEFIKLASKSSKLALEATIDDGNTISSSFDLTGLPALTSSIQEYCGK